MESWMILTKLILLLYIGFSYATQSSLNFPWVVLVILSYLCVNIIYYIVKKEAIKKWLNLLLICLVIGSSVIISPVLIVLLPINLFEWLYSYIQKSGLILLIGLLPEFFLVGDFRYSYGLVCFMSFIIYRVARDYSKRFLYYEKQADDARKRVQKLSKSLNENKEFIRQSEYTYKLEERNRVSQEIHDKIGHAMTGALIQMEAAKRLIDSNKIQATELLQNAINISKEGIEEIRLTLKNIKPRAEQMGIHRIKLYIDEFSSKHGIDTSFIYKGNLDIITPIQWKVIRENLGEAVTNTLKYADATIVSVEIQVFNKFVKMEVKDNGKGALKIKKGLGIAGMEERTAAINGKIIVDGTHGFSVTTLLPTQL